MAISNYSELQSAITDWLGDSGLSGDVQNIIQLAEARLNRKLKSVRADASLTATIDSRDIDVSSYNVIEPIALWNTFYEQDEEIPYLADGTFPYLDTSATPTAYTIDSNNDTINFNSPCDQAYTFRFRYRGRFALSDSATTNQLLTDHPDVYLAACLCWGGVKNQDAQLVQFHKALLDEFMMEAAHYLAEPDRGTLVVDGALARMGRSTYNINRDW